MKELTIEEKAEAYDKAIERAKKWYNAPNIDKIPTYGNRIIEEIFPELIESEDERIRKALICHISKISTEIPVGALHRINGVEIPDILAWLEKQNLIMAKSPQLGEQKPAWSEEDEDKLKSILFHIEDVENKDVINWLKSLKDQVQPQPKQEWGEEDERNLNDAILFIETGTYSLDKDNLINWLKSFRSQKQWKPSEEQITELHRVISGCSYDIEPLVEIEKHLKKLMEE